MKMISFVLLIAGGHLGILASTRLYQAVAHGKNILDATEGLMDLLLGSMLLVAASILYRLSTGRSHPVPDTALAIDPVKPRPADQPQGRCSYHPGQKPRPVDATETYLVDFNFNVLLANRWSRQGLAADTDDVHAWLVSHGFIQTPDGYLVDDSDLAQFERGEINYCRPVARNKRRLEDQRLYCARERARAKHQSAKSV